PVGQATMLLGAGRARVESTIDPAVGVILHKKTGDAAVSGEPLATVLINDESARDAAVEMIRGAYTIGDGPVTVPEMIIERL
ncbi:MAG TPA: thymidine phosphorylase, partial [Isosphaeraceae bacterium]|nr:thymidine phosphorylase [Isosphaeraceae bacterium]